MSDISESIFEVRFKPNARILDHRGDWGQRISDHMGLPEWKIDGNRLDVFERDLSNQAFLGFRNAGFTSKNSPSKNHFYDRAIKLFTFITQLDGFEKQPLIERLGIRQRFCTSVDVSFEDLRSRYLAKYLGLTEDAKKLLQAKLVDIGGNLNFSDALGNFNTSSGPMEQKQIMQFFQGWPHLEIPEVGFYFDIDYWVKPGKKMGASEVTALIRKFTEASWEKNEDMKILLLVD